MATYHDRSKNRPVRNALLKWQLQQDQRRVEEVRHRLMRMAAPSSLSPLGIDSSSFDRRLGGRRPRPASHNDPDEDALMELIMEREEREMTTTNQPVDRSKVSKLSSLLSPLQRSEVPPNNPVKSVVLRSTGQELNAAGDFYSPVRPRELSTSSSDVRQNLAMSRIKNSTPNDKSKASSPRNASRYDEMKTPARWRTIAMQSNQVEVDESALRKWEEEDALQADRLLEKAARDGDDEALWNDLFYRTKASHTKMSQLLEQPVEYSTGGFPVMASRSRSNLHSGPCYDSREDQLKLSENTATGHDGSTMSLSEHTKTFITQYSDIGSPAADASGTSDVLASTEKSTEAESSEDVGGSDDQNYDGSSGGDRKDFSQDEVFAGNGAFAGVEALSGMGFPRWSLVVIACCLVIGTCGFFIEELMALIDLFTTRSYSPLSRVEQERMRDRVSLLQQELRKFQLSTSEIEARSQMMLTELRQYMDRMRLDREKHREMFANEMQKLRRHILDETHELMKQERESAQTQLEEIVKAHVVNDGNAGDHSIAAGVVDIGNNENLIEIATEALAQVEVLLTMQESLHVAEVSLSTHNRDVNDEELLLDETKVESDRELVTNDGVAASSGQTFEHIDNEQAHREIAESEHVSVGVVKYVDEVESVSLSTPDQSVDETGIALLSTPNATVNAKPSHNVPGMSWDAILLYMGITFLVACVVLRIYNINRRKQWFEERRKRRNQRALRRAQRRARVMAEYQDDSDEWHDETDGDVEEVRLMTPVRDSKDNETRPKLQHQSSAIDTDVGKHRHSGQTPSSSTTTKTSSKSSRKSSLRHQRSPHQRRPQRVSEF